MKLTCQILFAGDWVKPKPLIRSTWYIQLSVFCLKVLARFKRSKEIILTLPLNHSILATLKASKVIQELIHVDLHKSIKGGDRDCLETRKTPPAWRSAYNKTKPNSWYLLCLIYTGPSFVVLYQSSPSPTNLKRTTLSIKPNWAFNYPSPINPTSIIEENATRNLWRIARQLSPKISSVHKDVVQQWPRAVARADPRL